MRIIVFCAGCNQQLDGASEPVSVTIRQNGKARTIYLCARCSASVLNGFPIAHGTAQPQAKVIEDASQETH